jgi:hypothetical protein
MLRSARMSDRQELIKLDAEIFALEQQLRDGGDVRGRLEELTKKRQQLLEEFAKNARDGIN